MASILIVCTGNVCRSPIAEGLLRTALQARLGEAARSVASAGTAGWEGSGATPEAVSVAGERGVDIGGHRARRLQPDHVDEADLVVAMAGEHREAIVSAMPDAAARTFTLKELVRLLEALPPAAEEVSFPGRIDAAAELRRTGFVGNPHDDDIVDPLGLPVESFRAVAWELEEWIGRLVDGLVGRAPAPAAAEGG